MARHKKKNSVNQNGNESIKPEKGSPKLFVIDLIIIGAIVFTAGYGFYIFMTKPEIHYYDTMTDITTNGEVWFHTSFNFTGETFSAEAPLTVSVYSFPDYDYYTKHPNEKSALGKHAYVYLPTADPTKPTFDHGILLGDPIILTRGDNDYFYQNSSATVVYHGEGQKCAIFSLVQKTQLPPCLPNATAVIPISSADTLYQLESNRTTTALTLLIFAFSIAVIRDFIKDFTQNFSSLRSKTKDEIRNNTPNEKIITTTDSDKDIIDKGKDSNNKNNPKNNNTS